MQQQEKYTLAWRSYSDHLREALGDMMSSNEFADVTLVTDDKQQIRAHRNILSACSPVFKSILQIDSNNVNPIIYLRGIQHSEMESIIQFIYRGEARFYEERMNEFLLVSKNLEIKDLSTSIDTNHPAHSIEEIDEYENNSLISDVKSIDKKSTAQTFNDDDTNDEHQTHTDNKPRKPKIDNANKKVSKTKGVKYHCSQCDYQANHSSNLTLHVQYKHQGVKYPCNQCDQQFSRPGGLTVHIKTKHEGVKYACNQCDYQAGYPGDLKKHNQSIHEGVRYTCDQCEKQYTDPSNLNNHKQAKHEGVKYACNLCDYRGSKEAIRYHLKIKHL